MLEADDRLAGDPVWELFPGIAAPPPSYRKSWPWIIIGVITLGWFVSQPASVAMLCLALFTRDFQHVRRRARSIPDEDGSRVCARFGYAWGAWKVGMAGFALMFVTILYSASIAGRGEAPPAFAVALVFWMGGFALSAVFTAAGLLTAYRSGMKVWVGEGTNQARTLMLGMLLVGFVMAILVPICLWLCANMPLAGGQTESAIPFFLMFFCCWFAGPLTILLILDWLSRRVVADRPGKFGPKVPTVAKWTSKSRA